MPFELTFAFSLSKNAWVVDVWDASILFFFFGLDGGGVGLLDLCFFRRFND